MLPLKILPIMYAALGTTTALFAQTESPVSIPGGSTTAIGALIVGFSTMLATLVWIVKKQFENSETREKTFTDSLAVQQDTFTKALERQNMVFATVFDKVRDDNRKILDRFTKRHEEMTGGGE